MRIVCIGDSLTQGYGVSKSETWVNLLNECWAADLINKGISGDTSSGMLSRFTKDVIEERPQYTILMGGVNDLLAGSDVGTIQSNVMAMVHQAYHNGIVPIIGISIKTDSVTFRKDWAELTSVTELNGHIREYRNWILKFCKIFNVPYIDFHGEFDNQIQGDYRRYLLDGLHPTRDGHKIMADIAKQNMNCMMNSKESL